MYPKSSGMSYITWKESAATLFKKICQREIKKDSPKAEPVSCTC